MQMNSFKFNLLRLNVRTLMALNFLYLTFSFLGLTSTCFAESYFQALQKAKSNDPQVIESIKSKTFNSEAIHQTNEFAKKLPKAPPPLKKDDTDEDEDEPSTSTSKTTENNAPSPKIPKNAPTKNSHGTVEKVVDVNKDNVPDELIFPDDSEEKPKPIPKK